MLSRVCALSQIYILDTFEESKMYPNIKALKELDRLNDISLNRNPTDWEKEDTQVMKIYSLNCRSLKKHYEDIIADTLLLKSDIIILQETWLLDDTIREDLEIPDYELHLNSHGRGKGLAIYFKSNIFSHVMDMKQEHMQLSKFSSRDLDIISLYRSKDGNLIELNQKIEEMVQQDKPQLLIGDFNYCYLDSCSK